MKNKIIVLLMLFIVSLPLISQEYEYVPTIKEEGQWSYCDALRTGSNEYDLSYFYYYSEGDTIINDKIYKKLYSYNCKSGKIAYVETMREEEKKIYVREDRDMEERLIYDFSLEVGD